MAGFSQTKRNQKHHVHLDHNNVAHKTQVQNLHKVSLSITVTSHKVSVRIKLQVMAIEAD
jgi:hypothetical protein